MSEGPEINPQLPLSEQYRLLARKAVELDAAATLLEESKSIVLAQHIAALIEAEGEMPHAKAERIVKASARWEEYIEEMVDARRQAALARVNVRWVEMRFQEWQSVAADARAERRM